MAHRQQCRPCRAFEPSAVGSASNTAIYAKSGINRRAIAGNPCYCSGCGGHPPAIGWQSIAILPCCIPVAAAASLCISGLHKLNLQFLFISDQKEVVRAEKLLFGLVLLSCFGSIIQLNPTVHNSNNSNSSSSSSSFQQQSPSLYQSLPPILPSPMSFIPATTLLV